MTDIYHFEISLKNILNRIETIDKDYKSFKKWYLFLKTDKTENLSTSRIVKLLGNIVILSDHLKDKTGRRLTEATKADLTNIVIWIDDSEKVPLTKT